MTTRGLIAAGLLVLTAGCGGNHTVDRAQWDKDLTDAGYAGSDIDVMEELFIGNDGLCENSQSEMEAFAAFSADEGTDAEVTRIGFENACPDKVDDFVAALEAVQDNGERFDKACATAPELRTQEQSDMAEATGC